MLVALLFIVYHETQTNNFAGKVGSYSALAQQRDQSYVFPSMGRKCKVWLKEKKKIVSQT